MSVFQFKQFSIRHQDAAMKVGTDSVLLGCLVQATHSVHRILDIGSGSGLLAMMMAQRFEEATIDAVEIDKAAAAEAAQNMSESKWSSRLQLFSVSFQEFVQQSESTYDLVVSNPPYYVAEANTLIEDVQRQTARHQSELSFADFLTGVFKLLTANGTCWVILPKQEGEAFMEMLTPHGFFLSDLIYVYPKQGKQYNRIIIGFGKTGNSSVQPQEFYIYAEDGTYTSSYYETTKDFLLWLNRR